jgi:hypothetical protein
MNKNIIILSISLIVIILGIVVLASDSNFLIPGSSEVSSDLSTNEEFNASISADDNLDYNNDAALVNDTRYTVPETNLSIKLPSSYEIPAVEQPLNPNYRPMPIAVYESNSEKTSSLKIYVYDYVMGFEQGTPSGSYTFTGNGWISDTREVETLPGTNILRFSAGDVGGYSQGVAVPDNNQMVVIRFSGDSNELGHTIYDGIDEVLSTVQMSTN